MRLILETWRYCSCVCSSGHLGCVCWDWGLGLGRGGLSSWLHTDVAQSICSLIPRFPSPDVPWPYIPQSLYFPGPFSPHKVRLFCSVSTFPSLFAPKSYVLQPLYSPLPTFPRNGFPSVCSPKTFPSSYKCSAPRSLYYPGPFKLFFSPDVPQNCYQSILPWAFSCISASKWQRHRQIMAGFGRHGGGRL